MAEKVLTVAEKIQKVRELVSEALFTDGEHHKQWYLFEIGQVIGLDIDVDETEQGIAP